MMTLTNFKSIIDHIFATARNPDTIQVGIQVVAPGSVGGTPLSGLKSVVKGFDWDNNKLILSPDDPLHMISVDEIASIEKSLKDAGWSLYEFENLKKENRRLRKLLENRDET
jgi:hypothetical protein